MIKALNDNVTSYCYIKSYLLYLSYLLYGWNCLINVYAGVCMHDAPAFKIAPGYLSEPSPTLTTAPGPVSAPLPTPAPGHI